MSHAGCIRCARGCRLRTEATQECAIVLADEHGPHTLEEISVHMGVGEQWESASDGGVDLSGFADEV